MIVTIHQPEFFPPLRFFHKVAQADAHIMLSGPGIHFDRGSLQHRARLRRPNGEGAQWMTIPFVHAGAGQPLAQVKPAVQDWPEAHWAVIRRLYSTQSWWGEIAIKEYFEGEHLAQMSTPNRGIWEAATRSLWFAWSVLGDPGKVFQDSAWDDIPIDRTARLVALCQRVGGTVYLSGRTGAAYLDLAQFEAAGIEVQIHKFSPPESGPELSILDTLFRYGAKQAQVWVARR